MAIRPDSSRSETLTIRVPMQWLDKARQRVTKGNTAIIHTALKYWLGIEDEEATTTATLQFDGRLTLIEKQLTELGELRERILLLEKQHCA